MFLKVFLTLGGRQMIITIFFVFCILEFKPLCLHQKKNVSAETGTVPAETKTVSAETKTVSAETKTVSAETEPFLRTVSAETEPFQQKRNRFCRNEN